MRNSNRHHTIHHHQQHNKKKTSQQNTQINPGQRPAAKHTHTHPNTYANQFACERRTSSWGSWTTGRGGWHGSPSTASSSPSARRRRRGPFVVCHVFPLEHNAGDEPTNGVQAARPLRRPAHNGDRPLQQHNTYTKKNVALRRRPIAGRPAEAAQLGVSIFAVGRRLKASRGRY